MFNFRIFISLMAIGVALDTFAADASLRILVKDLHMVHEVNFGDTSLGLLVRGTNQSQKKLQLRIVFPNSKVSSEIKKDCFKSAKLALADDKFAFDLYLVGMQPQLQGADLRGYQTVTIDIPEKMSGSQSIGCGLSNMKKTDLSNYDFKWFEF